MIWGRWYRAWVEPMTAKVMGVRLRPYTVGHEIALSWLQSPLVTGGNVGPADLMTAVYICCHEDAREGVQTLFSLKTKLAFAIWARLERKAVVLDEIKRFNEYRQRSRWYPSLFGSDDKAGKHKIGAPLEFVIVRNLCTNYNYTVDQVLKMPLQQACLLYFTDLDCEGVVSTVSEKDLMKMEGK